MRLAVHHEITLLTLHAPDEAPDPEALPPGLAAVHTVARRVPVVDDPLALLPAGVRYAYTHPAYAAAFTQLTTRAAFDVVQIEYQETMNAIPASTRPTVLTVHQIGFAADGPLWRAGGIGAAWGLYRHLRNLDWELRTIARARHVLTMSSEDARRLRRFLPDLPISVSPVGVDCTHYQPPAISPAQTTDLLFVGNFHHPPNEDAVRWLATEVLPRMGSPRHAAIVGRAMPEALDTWLEAHGLDVVGAVDDVRPHLACARIVVAPVRFGTGMRGKVLEALAMGRPVVTTSLGAEGLGAVSGQHLIIADDAPAFAAAVTQLLADPALAARIGAAGRGLVEARFDWSRIATDHERIYDDVLARPEAASALPADRSAWLAACARRLPMPWNGLLGTTVLAQRGLRWYLRAHR